MIHSQRDSPWETSGPSHIIVCLAADLTNSLMGLRMSQRTLAPFVLNKIVAFIVETSWPAIPPSPQNLRNLKG